MRQSSIFTKLFMANIWCVIVVFSLNAMENQACTHTIESKVKYHMRVTLYYYDEAFPQCQRTVHVHLKPWQTYVSPTTSCPLYKIDALIEGDPRGEIHAQRYFTQRKERGCGKHGFVGCGHWIIRKEDTSSGLYEIWQER